jgi:hypothetical protein
MIVAPDRRRRSKLITRRPLQRFYDLISAGDVDGFGDVLADDFVEHEEAAGLGPLFVRSFRSIVGGVVVPHPTSQGPG